MVNKDLNKYANKLVNAFLKNKIISILNGKVNIRPAVEIRESVRGWAAGAMTEKYNRIYDHMAQLNSIKL